MGSQEESEFEVVSGVPEVLPSSEHPRAGCAQQLCTPAGAAV